MTRPSAGLFFLTTECGRGSRKRSGLRFASRDADFTLSFSSTALGGAAAGNLVPLITGESKLDGTAAGSHKGSRCGGAGPFTRPGPSRAADGHGASPGDISRRPPLGKDERSCQTATGLINNCIEMKIKAVEACGAEHLVFQQTEAGVAASTFRGEPRPPPPRRGLEAEEAVLALNPQEVDYLPKLSKGSIFLCVGGGGGINQEAMFTPHRRRDVETFVQSEPISQEQQTSKHQQIFQDPPQIKTA